MRSVMKKFVSIRVPVPVPLLVVVIIALLAGVILKCTAGTKPFRDFSASDIAVAALEVKETGAGTSINQDEIRELEGLLHKVTIYEEAELDKAFYEKAVSFEIWTPDGSGVGSCTKIRSNPPYIEINGQGYRAKKKSCEKLRDFGYRITEPVE